ncbi:hypothetical protein PILCRDRAFT_385730 [Piloderma croceum F 1598]|uniref:Uncharacterized protein n=1 Tax=Piloderma croceum (strain F 1598) TaxID=765440 RepID=A0A0C3C4F6_PILCF|nr:hypothetical protein PILCRDRAFT_385730 [Piloderma croceum F 1598]
MTGAYRRSPQVWHRYPGKPHITSSIPLFIPPNTAIIHIKESSHFLFRFLLPTESFALSHDCFKSVRYPLLLVVYRFDFENTRHHTVLCVFFVRAKFVGRLHRRTGQMVQRHQHSLRSIAIIGYSFSGCFLCSY